jgi:hypothetical protein
VFDDGVSIPILLITASDLLYVSNSRGISRLKVGGMIRERHHFFWSDDVGLDAPARSRTPFRIGRTGDI